ncbi:Kinesin-like protein kip2 [Ascochyta rabiei]|uniref:Kinesin-like protein n=1 Tax=Didymella rabiei TaxID=5454 RepID=A0A163DKW0_DIDRA|nr:Kinesin-like protein kip2 [Ascochyta rabiei]KZM23223.1 ATP binding [Ascochyta rabiei]UPX17947.1 Kinesin-like protein kip2 [Ascochyta rabiei]
MSGNTLPRRSIAPPTGPLPSLPVPKQRSSNVSPAALRTPSSGLPSGLSSPSNRAVSYSTSPYRPGNAKHITSPSVPTIAAEHAPGGPPTGKSLRKVVSIGAFPQPPKHVGRTPSSPLASSASINGDSVDQRLSTGSKGSIPSRKSSLKKPRASNIGGGRGLLPKSPLSPPSFLNGNGSAESVAIDTSHLSLTSPPQSRNTSPHGSRSTSATTIEDGDDEARGRGSSKIDGEPTNKGNVIVSVRVRPDVGPKDGQQDRDWEVNGKRHTVSYHGRDGGGDYIYDNVFDTQDNNARVYDATAKRLVRRVMEGYHGTVFAYGMTGTGKTFSMQGTATNPGVIPLAITDIFSYIRETPHREFLLRVSYLEIYNEKINDLLAGPVIGMGGQPGQQDEIKLREDSKRGVYATPLKEEIVQSPTQLLRVISRGDQARRVAGTQFNSRSSRSHAVVQIVVESRERAPGPGLSGDKRSAIVPGGVRVSTLSLIDLAGSEKAADNKERRTEGSHINKSLLTLGAVVGGLAGNKTEKDGKKDNHLPYRDSKLTRLLQGALSGNSLVSILCTIQIGASGSVAASSSHNNETLNTLKFASRAKNNIVSHAKKADDSLGAGGDAGSRALLDRYRLEIQDLKKQLEEGKNREARDEEEDEFRRDKEEERAREQQDKQRHEEQMLEMQLARTALKERIEHLNRLILSSKSLGVNNGRTYSSLSLQRTSTFSHVSDFRPMSVRSSASHATLEVPRASVQSFPLPIEGSEEDDSVGENGDGLASQGVQIQALQADLADRNRYIATLEKRLLQARRSSHSRVSMSISSRHGGSEDGGLLATIAERDSEILSLRAQLEDKERMITALTAARKRNDTAHDVGSDSSPGSRRTSSYQRSEGSSINVLNAKGPTSPTSPPPPCFPPVPSSAGKNIEEMTRMLDEMITGRVDRAARRTSFMSGTEARRS